jgi:hypothetical protein
MKSDRDVELQLKKTAVAIAAVESSIKGVGDLDTLSNTRKTTLVALEQEQAMLTAEARILQWVLG